MRPLLVCVFVIFFGYAVNAQVGFGPEIGLGMSSMHFAPQTEPILYTSASKSPIISGKIGALVDEPLNKHLYFQAGISFSRRGGQRSFSYYTDSANHESVNQTLDINYIDVPINVVFKTGMQGKGRFIVGLGATGSYIIGGRNFLKDTFVYQGSGNNSSTDYQISVGSTITGFDIGVNVSAGYELPAGLFFRAYYTVGVQDIGVGTEVDKNRMWGIAAGYLFGQGRNISKEANDLIDRTPQ